MVELDDIDSFDPPSTTGFDLTPGDAENFLAYAFNEIHRYGMTGLWKNSPYLSSWGREYADGAIVEECYLDHACVQGPPRWGTDRGRLSRHTQSGPRVGAERGAPGPAQVRAWHACPGADPSRIRWD